MLPSANVFDSLSRLFNSWVWHLVVILLWIFLVLLWLALAYWTNRDARKRTRAPGLITWSTVLALVIPFIGPLVYLAVRPPETLEEAHARKLEILNLEKELEYARCPDCGERIEQRFLSCPSCMRKLREPCRHCGEALDPRWAVCPYCEKVAAPDLEALPTEADRDRMPS